MDPHWLQVRACHLSELGRRPRIEPHRHRDPQWYLCTDGTMIVEIDGQRLRCAPGQHLLVSPWRYRRVTAQARATYLMVRFTSSCIDHATWADRPQLLPSGCGEDLRILLERLAVPSGDQEPLVEVLLLRLLLAAQEGAARPFAAGLADRPRAEGRLALVLRFIRDHHPEAIGLTEIAAAGHCSPAHLVRLCRALRGCTPLQLLTAERMRRARELLLEDHRSIGAVAGTVGYATASHFGSVFKRIHGLTPRAFRRGEGRLWWHRQPVDEGPLP